MAITIKNDKRKNINIGDLNKLIDIGSIKQIVEGGLPKGEELVVRHKEVWAKVTGVSFRKDEFLHAQGLTYAEAKEFVVRYIEDITYDDIIVYKNKRYSVNSIFPLDENDEFLLITALRY